MPSGVALAKGPLGGCGGLANFPLPCVGGYADVAAADVGVVEDALRGRFASDAAAARGRTGVKTWVPPSPRCPGQWR